MGNIRETLLRLGVARPETISAYSERTSDVPDLPVWRDESSGVIFIDDHFVGKDTYKTGAHLKNGTRPFDAKSWSYEDQRDTERRVTSYKQFIAGRTICDYGCGEGSFLRSAKSHVSDAFGVDLRDDFRLALNRDGISCVSTIGEISQPLETIFMFHSFEHMPDPMAVLRDVHSHLANGGRVVIEVPHAKDFLLSQSEKFKSFTLWSQHLILHTRQSLEAFLAEAGFRDIVIEGVQRYGLANHLQWLRDGKHGGHRSNLSVLETDALRAAYAQSLSRLDANDTLVAIAIK